LFRKDIVTGFDVWLVQESMPKGAVPATVGAAVDVETAKKAADARLGVLLHEAKVWEVFGHTEATPDFYVREIGSFGEQVLSRIYVQGG
jgi:hypothetical protein